MRKTKSPYLSIAGLGLFLAGALTLGSCTNEDIPGKEEQGPAIEFGEVKTRAEVSKASQVKEFSVFAEQNYLNENGSESTDFISLLDNERVYRTGTNMDGEFTYYNTHYWVEGRTFNFFAVYPYIESTDNTQNVKPTVSTTFTQDNYKYEGYQIPFVTPENADVDIMTASDIIFIPENPEAYPTVDFLFTHALSKINIKVSNSANPNSKVALKKIELIGFSKEGTYNFSHDASYTNKWEITSDTKMTYDKELESNITDGGSIETLGDGLLLIPQSINANSVKVKITYDYYQFKDSEEAEETNVPAEAYLPIGNWEEGNHYTYNIILAAKTNDIYFVAPTVEQWSVPGSAGTIIIK